MARDTAPQKQPTEAQLREARLKAALKTNMARRKAQTRARDAAVPEDADDNKDSGPGRPEQES
ncbi:hypothetical protein [Sulfitobacter brevis]|uniref:hypothetical protein n=1 Tax=Sulfitobacter brevis TaxID=74348 RepID=UPI000B83FD77|nr:hypothetical protein [Sulfitobacter brevis]